MDSVQLLEDDDDIQGDQSLRNINSYMKKSEVHDDEKIELNDIELKITPELEQSNEELTNFYTDLLKESSFDMLSYICSRVCLSDDNEEWL